MKKNPTNKQANEKKQNYPKQDDQKKKNNNNKNIDLCNYSIGLHVLLEDRHEGNVSMSMKAIQTCTGYL